MNYQSDHIIAKWSGDNMMRSTFAGLLAVALFSSAHSQVLFQDDFEAGVGQWGLDGTATTFFGDLSEATSGTQSAGWNGTGVVAGFSTLTSQNLVNSGLSGSVVLEFNIRRFMQARRDGGQLHLQVNGGAWMVVPGTSMPSEPYNDIMDNEAGVPFAGEEAWTGNDGWRPAQVFLTDIGAGDTFAIRFVAGEDGSFSQTGTDWNIDDVMISATPVPEPATMAILGLGVLATAARRRRK